MVVVVASDARYGMDPVLVVASAWLHVVAVVAVVVVAQEEPVAGMEAAAAYFHLYFPQVHINWVSLIPSQEWQLQGRPDIALHWNWE